MSAAATATRWREVETVTVIFGRPAPPLDRSVLVVCTLTREDEVRARVSREIPGPSEPYL